MSVKGIIMFLGMNNTRLERKILTILDFENGFLSTYLPLWVEFNSVRVLSFVNGAAYFWPFSLKIITNLSSKVFDIKYYNTF